MIAPAMSLPVAFSTPSSPGEELTSITTAPWLARSMSTPQTLSPMDLAARTAVERSSGVSRTTSAEPPRCRLERKSPSRPGAFHRRDDLAADHQRADIGAAGLLDELLHQDVHVGAAERFDHRFRRAVGIGQHHADALGALEQLDHQRRAAGELQHLFGLFRIMGEGGDRQADAVARQKLHRAQLVARAADGDTFVERVDALHLELAQHGQCRRR